MRFVIPVLLLWLAFGRLKAQETPDRLVQRAREVLAPLDGELGFAGLKEPVEVLRDRWGVAHIYARNADDLFFAQGVVVAQDRLFQIDWWRRVATGETAEVLGPSALEADRFARLIRYRGDMEREWTSYAPDTRAIAVAFTQGINAWIDRVRTRLPIEFQLAGYEPKRWQPEDILGRMSGIIMSRNIEQEIARAQLVASVGLKRAEQLAPTDPPVAWEPAPGLDFAGIAPAIYAGYKAATKSPAFTPSKTESNNWVVDGSRSASGKPLLASDPHRTIALPSLRYLVHLNAPGWNVIGAGEPALPGVAIGHNERIAWGFTIVGTDQADLVIEQTAFDDPKRYRTESGWQPMKVVHESVPVKGQRDPARLELRYTRNGPVLHQDEKRHRAYVLRWAGSEPGGAAYLPSLSVARAQNRQQFLEALERWKLPCLNFVYADVEGQIGWVAAAATPVRRKGHGLLPVPGWTEEYGWERYRKVAELPQSFDPPQHWLGTANHNILPAGYDREVAYEWAPPHRYRRIHEVLDGDRKFTRDDFERLQYDSVSLPGRALARLLGAATTIPATLAPYAKLLAGWDGDLTRDSRAGPLYAVWLQELTKDFSLRAGKEIAEPLRTLNHVGVVLQALEHPAEPWFKDAEDRDRFLVTTFARAVERTSKLLGSDPTGWRWGKLHTATFHHPLSKAGIAYARAFDRGPVERGGDANTPQNTRHDDSFAQIHGASYRHIFDLADWDRGVATSTPGQSGQPGSPHYDDLLPLWAEGRYFPLVYTRSGVEKEAAHRLRLRPTPP